MEAREIIFSTFEFPCQISALPWLEPFSELRKMLVVLGKPRNVRIWEMELLAEADLCRTGFNGPSEQPAGCMHGVCAEYLVGTEFLIVLQFLPALLLVTKYEICPVDEQQSNDH